MTRTVTGLSALAFAAALAVGTALAEAETAPPAPESGAQESMLNMLSMRAGTEMSEADRGYMKAMQTMQQTLMKTEMTGDPSGDFLRIMIPHHQSAVAMVDVLLQQKDVDPAVRDMAENMRAEQMKEIGEMQKRLESYPK